VRTPYHFFLISLTIILLAACSPAKIAVTTTPAMLLPGQDVEQIDFSQIDCQARADDPQGYLLSICEYILDNNINTSPADPSKLNILEIHEENRDGREVFVVFLDCCGMGDRAVLDAGIGEVLEYHLGDY
jgi:hypothetical protein